MKQRIMMVGPTVVPERVLNAMNRPSISHRSPEYMEVHKRVRQGLKQIFQTENEVFILTSSGTGAMEAAIQNCFSFGDEVVVAVLGIFSEQFAQMAEAFQLKVKRVAVAPGERVNVDELMSHVSPATKGVFIIHNESSTGVFNDLKAFGDRLKDTETLLIVDSVSGAAGLPVKMDEWHIDILLSSSQKALMTPAGLSFISLNQKAWSRVETSNIPKYYFDLRKARDFQEKNQTPNTPAVYNVFAVDESLKMIFEEGYDNVLARHEANTQRLINGVKELGYGILPVEEAAASRTLTAVTAKGQAKNIVEFLEREGIIVNGGLGALAEDMFRVGIMGYVLPEDVDAFLSVLAKFEG
ncbi:MAG: alanine--glyoxylate aminotransferase family protein [Clostridiaceae bacterium]